MERGTTLFLKAAVWFVGAVILALCIAGLPSIAKEAAGDYPKLVYGPVIAVVYVTAVPFFIALFQTLSLLRYIDRNEAFSERSVVALKKIKYCAAAIGILYAAGTPFLFTLAQEDDAPGLAALGLVVIFASLVIAVFAAVLQKLLKHAIDMKAENDLTV